MWDAEREGRIADLLALMDPHVVCTPTTRPGRSIYIGQTGVVAMLDTMDRMLGRRRIVIDEILSQADATVLTRGRALSQDSPESRGVAFEMVCEVRDGLIIVIHSR
jgi:hypothetical protein